jgi:hypothetical protein
MEAGDIIPDPIPEKRKVGRPRCFTVEQAHERKLASMNRWRATNKEAIRAYNVNEDSVARRRARYPLIKDPLNAHRRELYRLRVERQQAEAPL